MAKKTEAATLAEIPWAANAKLLIADRDGSSISPPPSDNLGPDWQALTLTSAEPLAPIEFQQVWTDGATLDVFRGCGSDSNQFRLRFWGGMSIDVDYARRTASDSSITSIGETELRHLLDDLVAPRVIAHDGGFVLHAGAVRLGNDAVVLLGESGRGKSTLSTMFDREGHPLIGDDALVISTPGEIAHAEAIYPSLRLLPDSIAALLANDAASEPISEFSDKRRLLAPRARHPALPIRCLFVLGDDTADRSISFRRLTVAEACMTILANSFALDPTDRDRARTRLDRASALARNVPTFEVAYPRKYDQLREVMRAIIGKATIVSE